MSSASVKKHLLDNKDFIKDCYSHNVPNEKSEYFSLVTSPFKVLKLRDVLSCSDYKKQLKKAIESIPLRKKENDLYSLWQSDDLNNCELKVIKKFINVLQKEIAPFLADICDVQLNEKISITASLYKQEDVLLCHDDKCEDRCIAFVYYLNGSDSSGGSFEMFAHDENDQPTEVVRSIPPEENSLICFEVGNLTYHQVSEVTDEHFQRWSINGWFHSDRKLPLLKYEEPMPPMQKQSPLQGLVLLDEYVNATYCTPNVLLQMQDEFAEESFLLLKDMFVANLFSSCSSELANNKFNWKKVGPANRRNYYITDLNQLTKSLSSLVKLLMSPLFISFLKKITGLDLVPYQGEDHPSSELIVELIKWTPGCYTMATDNDIFFKKPGLDLFIFFGSEKCLTTANDSSGYVTYLDSGDDNDNDAFSSDESCNDKELITIVPVDNGMNLVYRTDKTVRFTKYINHSIKGEYYAIYATYYEDWSPM